MPPSASPPHPPALPPFPTRRSSDLSPPHPGTSAINRLPRIASSWRSHASHGPQGVTDIFAVMPKACFQHDDRRSWGYATAPADLCRRSEEHTSELQSPCNLVCRPLPRPPTPPRSPPSLHDALPIYRRPTQAQARSTAFPGSHRHGGAMLRMDPRASPTFSRSCRRRASSTTTEDHGATLRPRLTCAGGRKSTRLNSSHLVISYAALCLAPPPPRAPPLPYTTLFRSIAAPPRHKRDQPPSPDRIVMAEPCFAWTPGRHRHFRGHAEGVLPARRQKIMGLRYGPG